VLNVFMESVRDGSGAALARNATWRFYNQELEHIRPLAATSTETAAIFSATFSPLTPRLAEKISAHDALRAQLVKAATDAYRDALASDAIHKAVDDARRRFLEKVPGAIPTGSFAAEKHVDLVIERLINEIDELPSHNTDAEFWRAHARSSALSAFHPCRWSSGHGPSFSHPTRQYLNGLEDFSYDLCQQYDIPAAPSSSVGY